MAGNAKAIPLDLQMASPLGGPSNVLKDLKGVWSGLVWSGRPYLLSSHISLLVSTHVTVPMSSHTSVLVLTHATVPMSSHVSVLVLTQVSCF